MRGALLLIVNTSTCWKTELHLTNFGVLYHLLHIEFHGVNSRIDVLGLSDLVSCHKLNFLQTVRVPLIF